MHKGIFIAAVKIKQIEIQAGFNHNEICKIPGSWMYMEMEGYLLEYSDSNYRNLKAYEEIKKSTPNVSVNIKFSSEPDYSDFIQEEGNEFCIGELRIREDDSNIFAYLNLELETQIMDILQFFRDKIISIRPSFYINKNPISSGNEDVTEYIKSIGFELYK